MNLFERSRDRHIIALHLFCRQENGVSARLYKKGKFWYIVTGCKEKGRYDAADRSDFTDSRPLQSRRKARCFLQGGLERQGAEGVYVDDALNVIYPIGCMRDNPLTV